MIGIDMMAFCAPQVAPQTIQAIIHVESGGNPLAIGINGPIKLPHRPSDAIEAARLARWAIHLGYSVDLGLMQVNSRNLPHMGYTIEQMFDPCTNIQAGSRILVRGYRGATKRFGPGQDALRAALSAYNTGNYEYGFKNGYVAKYYRKAPHYQTIVSRPIIPPLRAKPIMTLTSKIQNPLTSETTIFKLSEEE